MRMERRLRLGGLVLHPLTDNLCRRLLGCARRAAGYRLQPHAAGQRNADARPAAGDGRRCVVPFGAQHEKEGLGPQSRYSLFKSCQKAVRFVTCHI
jgi:hypothetical protein